MRMHVQVWNRCSPTGRADPTQAGIRVFRTDAGCTAKASSKEGAQTCHLCSSCTAHPTPPHAPLLNPACNLFLPVPRRTLTLSNYPCAMQVCRTQEASDPRMQLKLWLLSSDAQWWRMPWAAKNVTVPAWPGNEPGGTGSAGGTGSTNSTSSLNATAAVSSNTTASSTRKTATNATTNVNATTSSSATATAVTARAAGTLGSTPNTPSTGRIGRRALMKQHQLLLLQQLQRLMHDGAEADLGTKATKPRLSAQQRRRAREEGVGAQTVQHHHPWQPAVHPLAHYVMLNAYTAVKSIVDPGATASFAVHEFSPIRWPGVFMGGSVGIDKGCARFLHLVSATS